jgi:hypothetical protein
MEGILIIRCVVTSCNNVASFRRFFFSVVPYVLLFGNSQRVDYVKSTAVFFEVFFPCSLTGTITHIVVGNLAPLHILWYTI